MRESWIFDLPREERDILPSIFSTQSVSLIVRCVATSIVFVSGAGASEFLHFLLVWLRLLIGGERSRSVAGSHAGLA